MLFLVMGGFLLLLLIGLPVYLALAIPSLIYIVTEGLPLSTAAYAVYQSITSFSLVAAPLFILMGALANEFGETERIFLFAKRLLRSRPGYSARVNVVVSLIFAGISGSAVADVGGLGQIEARAMEREGFKRDYAGALSAATAVVGPIFPPSIPLIIFAATAQVSTLDALLAGIVPALVITGVLYLFVVWQVPRKLTRPVTVTDFAGEGDPGFIASLTGALPMLLLVPLIVGGMLLGAMSPTEAGAFAVLYLVALQAMRGKLTLQGSVRCLSDTFTVTASILLVVGAAAIFGRVLVLERFPQLVTMWFLQLSDNPIVVLLVINALLLLIGMFMETIAALVIMTPILLTVTSGIGVDPIHLGVILVFNLTIGLVTPPLGVAVYTVSSVIGVPPDRVFKELLPLYIPLLIALLIITFVPSTSLLFR